MAEKANPICEDANAVLAQYASSMDWRTTRALVFLDPFGLEVRWETISLLAETGGWDVWYLFPLSGVIRMMQKDGQIPDTWMVRLDQLFGTHDWFAEFYVADMQESLFDGEQEIVYRDADTQQFVTYICNRLKTVFPEVSKAGILRNQKGAPLFALILGVSNPSKPAQAAALHIGNHLVKELTGK